MKRSHFCLRLITLLFSLIATSANANDCRHNTPGLQFFRDPLSPAAQAWIDRENARVKELAKHPAFAADVRARLEQLKSQGPETRSLFSRGEIVMDGKKLVLKQPDGKVLTLFSIEAHPEGASLGWRLSPDESKLAISLRPDDRDIFYWHFFDFTTNTLLKDEPISIHMQNLNWNLTSDGVFYSTWPSEEEERRLRHAGKTRRLHVRFHKLGTPASQDEFIYENKEPVPTIVPKVVELVPGKVYFSFRDQGGVRVSLRSEIGIRGPYGVTWKPYRIKNDIYMGHIGQEGGTLYFISNEMSQNYGIVTFSWANGKSIWKTIIAPRQNEVLKGATRVGEYLFVQWIDPKIRAVLRVYELNGALVKEIRPKDLGFPEIANIGSPSGSISAPHGYLTASTPGHPTQTFQIDFPSLKISHLRNRVPHPFEQGVQVIVEGYDVLSTDKRALLPVKVISRADQKPKFLYLDYYGAIHGISHPGFSQWNQIILEMGGAVASIGVRGGGERGYNWYREGTDNPSLRAQDVVAATEAIRKTFDLPRTRVVGNGSSWGGYLSNLIATLYPGAIDILFAGAPVGDLTLFHHSRLWFMFIDDFGIPRDRQGYLTSLSAAQNHARRHSPVHFVPGMTAFKGLLVASIGGLDDRVDPEQGYYLTYELQKKFGCNVHAYVSTDPKIGHRITRDEMINNLSIIAKRYGIGSLVPLRKGQPKFVWRQSL